LGIGQFLAIVSILQSHAMASWPFNSRNYSTQGSRASCYVSFSFYFRFFGKRLTLNLFLRFNLRLGDYALGGVHFFKLHYHMLLPLWEDLDFKTTHVSSKTFRARTWGRLGTTRESFKTTQGWSGVHSSLVAVQVLLIIFACSIRGRLRTTRKGLQDYSNPLHSPTKYSGTCRMDIWGPTNHVVHARTKHGTLGLLSDVDRDTRWCSLHGNHMTILEYESTQYTQQ
jgi:hypothetical protein